MGFQAQKFGFMQGWTAQSATAMYSQPTGKLGGFFRDPQLYLQLSQVGTLSRGDMSWQSARRLALLVDDRSFVADKLLVGAPPRQITVPPGPDSADVLPPTFGPLYYLSGLGDAVTKDALHVGNAYARLLGLHPVQRDVAEEFRPMDDFVSESGRTRGLAYTVADIQSVVLPQKLLAQRVLSMSSQKHMENIPLQPFPEDSQRIKGVIKNVLTEKALYFVRSSVPNYEKLAEMMWFSMLWYGFSKFSPERQADISVVMESLEDELHDRLTGAIAELNGPQLDRKLIAAATLAVVHPAVFTMDPSLLDKAVRSLTMMTAHQNADVSYNANQMLARLVKHAGDAHPEVVATALAAMTDHENLQVSHTAVELLACVVESSGLAYSSIVAPAAQAMRGAMLGLKDRNLGSAHEIAFKYFEDRLLRVDTVSVSVVAQQIQVIKEMYARVQSLSQEQLQVHP